MHLNSLTCRARPPDLKIRRRILLRSILANDILPPAARQSSIIQSLEVGIPLSQIRAQDTAIIRQHAIDFALDVRRLRPDAAGAREALDLVFHLAQDEVRPVVPDVEVRVDLVGLVDFVDGSGYFP